jgi:hypothetical protein
MTEGLPKVRGNTGKHAQMGMPKMAKRVWPTEEGIQGPGFWRREEEFVNQHWRTNMDLHMAMQYLIEDVRTYVDYTPSQIQTLLDAYDIRRKEIYTAHRKAIRAIKDMYPSVI